MVVAELGIRSNHLSTTYKAACPTQDGIEYLDYMTRVTKKYMDNICDKYHSSLKDGAVEKALSRLSYTIKLAEDKSKELQGNVQENEDPEPTADEIPKEKSFQASLQHPRVTAHLCPNTKGLTSSAPDIGIPKDQPNTSNPITSDTKESNKEPDY